MKLFNELKLLFAGDDLTDLIFLSNKEREALNYSLAIKYQLRIKSILKNYPDNKETREVIVSNYYLLVNDYLNIKQIDKAEKEALEAYQLFPQNSKILRAYILVLYDKNEFAEALLIANKILINSPENIDALYYRGVCNGQLGNYQDSLCDFLKVAQNEPEYSETQYNIGKSYERLKDYDKAIIYYTKAIELDALYIDAYVSRGNCYVEISKKDKACEDFHKALELGEEKVQGNIDKYCKSENSVSD